MAHYLDAFFADSELDNNTITSFFRTVALRLRPMFGINDDDGLPEGDMLPDLRLRVINQLLSYQYEHWDAEQGTDVPNSHNVALEWLDDIADFIYKRFIRPYNQVDAELLMVTNQLSQIVINPQHGVWHKCYHCLKAFERASWLDNCNHCEGWLVVEVDPVGQDFLFEADVVVPWENARLHRGKESALVAFGGFQILEDHDEECLVCHESGLDQWKQTTCKHTYCFSCLRGWLQNNSNCPYCLKQFPRDGQLAALFRRSSEIREHANYVVFFLPSPS